MSDAQVEQALTDAGASTELTQAVVDVIEAARVDGLRTALAVLAVIATIALFFTRRIPTVQPGKERAEPIATTG